MMTPSGFRDVLSALRRRLFSADIQSWVETGGWSQEEKDRFVRFRRELDRYLTALDNADLAKIANDLAEIEPEFNRAKEELSGAIERLETLAQVVSTLATLLGIAARIAAKLAL